MRTDVTAQQSALINSDDRTLGEKLRASFSPVIEVFDGPLILRRFRFNGRSRQKRHRAAALQNLAEVRLFR